MEVELAGCISKRWSWNKKSIKDNRGQIKRFERGLLETLVEGVQTDEQEVVWVLELPVKRLIVPMEESLVEGWTSSTTECLTLCRTVGVVQPWEGLGWYKNE